MRGWGARGLRDGPGLPRLRSAQGSAVRREPPFRLVAHRNRLWQPLPTFGFGARPAAGADIARLRQMTTPVHTTYSRRGMEVLEEIAGREPLAIGVRTFYFLRHGQTEGNRTRIYQPADIPLNDTGLAQARLAAEQLRDHPIRRIRASDMARAWTTAGIVAEVIGLPVEAEPGLRERWFGDLVGSSSADLDWTRDPPNGETLAGFIQRARAGIAAALDADGTTLMVSHGGVLHVLLGSLRLPVRPEYTANAAPLLFEAEGSGWRVTPLLPEAEAAPPDSIS